MGTTDQTQGNSIPKSQQILHAKSFDELHAILGDITQEEEQFLSSLGTTAELLEEDEKYEPDPDFTQRLIARTLAELGTKADSHE